MRDASRDGPAAPAQDRRNLAPAVDSAQPDLAAGDEAEEEGQRRGLGRQAALSLHPAPKLLVQPLNHVRGPERLPLSLGKREEREQLVAPFLEAGTTPGQRARHFRSKAAKAFRAAPRLSA